MSLQLRRHSLIKWSRGYANCCNFNTIAFLDHTLPMLVGNLWPLIFTHCMSKSKPNPNQMLLVQSETLLI